MSPERITPQEVSMQSVAAERLLSSVNGAPARNGRKAMIYTRMGVVFHAATWSESTYGITADGVWSTGPTAMEVFLPWPSIDSIRFG
jgi:hypothetical protein